MPFSWSDIFAGFGYTLSIPERLGRTLAAALGGTSKLLTDTLIPEPLRKTSTYAAIVGNAQRFVIEQVALVQNVYAKDAAGDLPDNFVQRKIAGNVIDAAGIFSLHLSPLWVFAIASDVSRGSKVYLEKLVDELKRTSVLAGDANINELSQLLDAVGEAGKESAKVFDAPPVDVAQIKELRDRLMTGYSNVFREATDLVPRMDDIWAKMEALAKRDNVAIESIIGLMTVDLGQVAGKAVGTAFAVGNVTTDLIADTIFRSYGETITKIQTQGALTCLDDATRPFLDAVAAHLNIEKQTWTERTMNKLLSPWFGPPENPVSPAEPPADSAPGA